jgi:hypothetical protein|tara:strand:- start:1942 stop:2367 length:426 start_codon:yes stop_codon:yes gene_type:complete
MEQNINLVSQTTEQSPPQQQSKEDWELEFDKYKDLIEKAIGYTDSYTIDDVKYKIENGIASIWGGKQTVIITEFVVFPKKNVLHILCIAGDYEEVEEMFKSIEKYARSIGINKITGSGRKGWLRKVKHLGFKQEYLISKDL